MEELTQEQKDVVFLSNISSIIKRNPHLASKAITAVSYGISEAAQEINEKFNFIDLAMNMYDKKSLHDMFSRMNQKFVKKHGLEKHINN